MPGIDFNRSRKVWHNHIARWGGGVGKGKLVRSGVKRTATMAMVEYTPRERASIAVDGAVRFWISAYNVATANVPDFELDTIEFKGIGYKIVLPVSGQRPDGSYVAFDCTCMSTGPL
jgi:hypothetical protein